MKYVAIAILVVGLAFLARSFYTPKTPDAVPTKERLQPIAANSQSELTPADKVSTSEIVVPANVEQVDTGIKVRKGQSVTITATGQVNGASSPSDSSFGWFGPDGQGVGSTTNNGRKRPLPPGSSFMALCYRIGSGSLPIDDEKWSLAGGSKTFTANESGTLHLTVNDAIRNKDGQYLISWRTDNQGQFTVQIRVE